MLGKYTQLSFQEELGNERILWIIHDIPKFLLKLVGITLQFRFERQEYTQAHTDTHNLDLNTKNTQAHIHTKENV